LNYISYFSNKKSIDGKITKVQIHIVQLYRKVMKKRNDKVSRNKQLVISIFFLKKKLRS
jgi:phage gp16-like protein